MSDREELEALRRLAELEAKASGSTSSTSQEDSILRKLKLGASSLVKGAAGLPALALDLVAPQGATDAEMASSFASRAPDPGMQRIVRGELPMGATASLQKFGAAPRTKGEETADVLLQGVGGGLLGGAAMGLPARGLALAGASGGSAALTQDALEERGAPTWAQIAGSLLGGAAPIAVASVGRPVAHAARHVTEGFSQSGRDQMKGRLLREVAGERADDVQFQLSKTPPYIPGVQRTASRAAVDAGSTEFAGLEKLLAERYAPSKYMDLRRGNEDAMAIAEFLAVGPGSRAKIGDNIQIEKILQRRADEQARAGKLAAQLKVRDVLEPLQPPGMIDRGVTIARAILGRLQGSASKKALKELSSDMLDPKTVQILMQNATPAERLELQEVLKALAAGQVGGVLPQSAGTIPQ